MADRKANIYIASPDVESAKALTDVLVYEVPRLEELLTIHRCVPLRKEPSMSLLKEVGNAGMDSDMECLDSDLTADGNSAKRRWNSPERNRSQRDSVTMKKKLKTYPEQSTSFESNVQEQMHESNHSMVADVCIVIVHPKPMSFLPAFIFAMCKPGILVVPFQRGMSDQDRLLATDIIKEIGQGWKNGGDIRLLLVDMAPTTDSDKVTADKERTYCVSKITSDLFKTDFYSCMDFCSCRELNEKIKNLLEIHGLSKELTENHKRYIEMLNKIDIETPFFEISPSDSISLSEDLLKDTLTGCCEFGKTNKFYRIESVMNPLQYLASRRAVATYCMELSELNSELDQYPDPRILLEAFLKENLVYIRSVKTVKTVFLCPFFDSRYLGRYDKVDEFSSYTNVLRLTVKSYCVPGCLVTSILSELTKQDWKVHSWDVQDCKYAYFLCKDIFGLKLTFSSIDAHCCIKLQIVASESSTNESHRVDILCEELRVDIEKSMNKCCNTDSVKQYVNSNDSESLESVGDSNWTDVEAFTSKGERLIQGFRNPLEHWFPSKARELVEDVEGEVEKFLADVSLIFGTDYYLFFVDQGVPSQTIDRYREENNNNLTKVIFLLLKDWWRMKNEVSLLRQALMKSPLSRISIPQFDRLVKKHFS